MDTQSKYRELEEGLLDYLTQNSKTSEKEYDMEKTMRETLQRSLARTQPGKAVEEDREESDSSGHWI